ncbi:amidohydrolase family protein [Verminephrobacter eiseniae]|uniref:amidohydrolase family protein n=1 Tax=Verminephrobacter eiseniae TaxID=364317 RepID=UPI002AA29B3F|nr:amidohydrolase family protein [Verminephrobacter eiseniae]MCW5237467.1 hypothetical protein [Verminephrobacter eiseniae]
MLNTAASLPPPSEYQKPRFAVPRGACDSHTHVIPESGWKLVPEASYIPALAPSPVHMAMLNALGLEHGVVVQPSIFGTDNTVVVEAIAQAPQRLRGVAAVNPSIADSTLQALHEQGIRGVRFNVMLGGGGGIKAMTELASRLAALNWHAEILVDGHLLPDLRPALQALPCRLVIDHMASLRADIGPDAAPVRALRELVADRDTWVKLSGAYRLADQPSDARLAERGRMLESHVTLVYAMTDAGLTSFLVDTYLPGLTRRHSEPLGYRFLPTADMIFEDVRVPDAALLGAPGEGMKTFLSTFNVSRLGNASELIGFATRALAEATDYAKQMLH